MNPEILNPAPRRKKKSSKANLIISLVFHVVVVLAVFLLAAKEGMLGKKMQTLTATLVPKDKKPEPQKEKPPEPKMEQAKTEAPKAVMPVTASAPPPASDLAPAAAPAANALPAFEFNDGAKDVQTISNPIDLYKALVESALRSHWNRPDMPGDENFTADVELTVDAKGNIVDSRWVKGSGNSQWDATVKAALTETTALSRPPPKDFPNTFTVRFDVDATQPDEAMQLGSR